jgi:hypothetical protein
MNQKNISAIIYLSAIVAVSVLIVSSSQNEVRAQQQPKNLRFVENNSFGYGEKFEYDVQYGFIKAGEGTIQVMPKPVYRYNRECYDVRFEARSLKSLEFLYRVLDRYKTSLDVSGIFSWEFEQNIREGNYKHDSKATFDQFSNIAYANKKQYPIPPHVHDVISAFYYVRTLNLGTMKKGSIINLQNFWKDSTYTLGVKYHGKANVEVPAGKFRCVVVEPVDMQGGLFRNIGSIYIYLTDDERKMPVKVASKILIGEVTAELTKYSGLRGPVNARIQ